MPFLLLFIALLAASLNMRPVITSVSPLLSNIQGDLAMSSLQASLLTTLPVLCMGLFAPVAVSISRRFGMERTIFASMVLIGAATAARGVLSSASGLILTALAAGVGIGIAGPLLSGFIKRYFPGRTAMVSVYSAALVLGASLAAGLSVPLFTWLDSSWQLSLAVWAVLSLAALPAWWRITAKSLQPEAQSVHAKLPVANKRAWLLTVFFGLMASVFYSLTAWLAPIAMSMGYSRHDAGNLLTLFTLIQIPVSILVPILTSRFQRRTLWLVLCSLFELSGLLLLLGSGFPFLSAVLLGIGAGGLFPLALMLPLLMTQRAEEASAWSSLSQGGGYILGALGPLAVGRILDASGSFRLALTGLAVVTVLMIAVQLMIGRSSREGQRAKEQLN
ncbi:MFS transporter [Paenibacillus sp. FSL R7-0337]|uniref:MFS transporter n=1 Tax=Paenibacillus sp. FSL R7-0337 TaxID=1926588 RepID=UPI00096FFBAF|nr:MFS transporter [Paenibacillus sp. FSL R7-0337]OMF89519.1 MFS transporter [Paenibacillus sp. FSL R7-0337]